VGVKDATRILRQGEIIELNGSTGEIVRVRQPVAERPEAAAAMAAK